MAQLGTQTEFGTVQNTEEQVNKLFQQYFGRAPDSSELIAYQAMHPDNLVRNLGQDAYYEKQNKQSLANQANPNSPFYQAPGGRIEQPPSLSPTSPSPAVTQYIKDKGSNDVFAIINGKSYYIPYDYAVSNNVFPQVKEVKAGSVNKYPSGGTIAMAPPAQPSITPPQAPSAPPAVPTSATDPSTFPYVRYSGSGNVFERRSGRNIPYEEATQIPNFWNQIQDFPAGIINPFVSPNQSAQSTPPAPPAAPIPPPASTEQGTTLKGLIEDPKLKNLYDTLPNTMKGLVDALSRKLDTMIEQGKVVNPDIEISPSQIIQFLADAKTELDPYYQEQIGLAQKDFDRAIKETQADWETQTGRLQEPLQRQLETQAEAEAQAGTAFSSGRVERQKSYIDKQQQAIDDAARTASRGIGNLGRQAERTLGSSFFSGANAGLSGGINEIQISPEGKIMTGQRILPFTPEGGIMGTIPRQRKFNEEQRIGELSEAFRNKRLLDLRNL